MDVLLNDVACIANYIALRVNVIRIDGDDYLF